MNRRTFILCSAAYSLLPSHQSVVAQTPVALRSFDTGVDGIIVDHFRIVDGDTSGSVLLGALVNQSTESIDVPDLLQCTVRDKEAIIIGDGFVMADYPVLAPASRVGFTVSLFDLAPEEIDPGRTQFESRLGGANPTTRMVDFLEENPITIVSAVESIRDESGFELTIEFTNEGPMRLENGVTLDVSIWDENGLYCGNSYANVMYAIDSGESARVKTVQALPDYLPLRIAGNGFTWEPMIAAREY